MVTLKRLSRHSRTPLSPAVLRLTASISTRPNLRPRSSKSSTTMSSAGTLAGCSSSKVSTSLAEDGGSTKRARRAYTRPGLLEVAWRYST